MKNLNKYFDSTLLKPEVTADQIVALCKEAIRYDFYAVCVNPCYVPLAAATLQNSDVNVATVIGFPLGTTTTDVKAFETAEACRNGADEIDMVMNVGAFKSGDFDYVSNEIERVVASASAGGAIVKVILEICLLNDEEIISACELAKTAGAEFVKTSTGFNSGGATAAAVKLMRDTVGETIGVKAAGGIRDLATAMTMIEAGADRLGCSACAKIMSEYSKR